MSRATGRRTILHVSDVHATEGELLYGTVDGFERLSRVGEYARETGMTPEAIVVTGDLIQRGHAGAYPTLGRELEILEDRAGVPVLTVLGNHDERDAARILPGHAESHYRAVHVDDLRLLLLDSSTGELGGEQREWLAVQLRSPHGIGTVVALHHPPLGSPMPTLAKAGLRDADAFLDVLEGTDARVVLAGHFHHTLAATMRGISVSVGPSLAYHQVMDAGPHRVSGHDQAMFSIVHLVPGAVMATAVNLASPAPLFSSPVSVPTR